MALRVFDKSRFKPVGEEYSETESNILKEYFTESRDVDDYKANFANHVFDYLKREELHLACDCSPGSSPPPLLVPAIPLSLKRMPSTANTPHHKNCCFASRLYEVRVNPNREEPLDDAIFSLFPAFSVGRERPPRLMGEAGEVQRRSGLSEILFKVMKKAWVNWIFHDDMIDCEERAKNHQKRANRMEQAAQSFFIAADDLRKVALGNVVVAAISESKGIREIVKLKDRLATWADWPNGSRAQGFLITTVTSFRQDSEDGPYKLEVPDWENLQYVESKPNIFAESTPSERRAPYVAIVAYCSSATYGV